MKLSQIRMLSWSAAFVVSCGAGYGVWDTVQKVREPSGFVQESWSPAQPTLPDMNRIVRLGNQRIMSALAFLTKVKEVPVVVVDSPKTTTDIVEEPKETKALDLGYELVLISYDETNGRHLVFLRRDREAHPYTLGDRLEGYPPSVVHFIAKDYVELLAKDGRKQVLYLNAKSLDKTNAAASGSGFEQGIARVVPEPAPVVETKPVLETTPSARSNRRYVPQTRDVEVNENYGIQVVKYNNSEDGAERYAISEKDLASLQTQALRLMSEVAPSTAYGDSGDPIGIRLDYIVENPLAKSYGIQNGDVLTKVADKPVASEQDAQSIYDQLGGKTRVVPIDVLRNGVNIRINFEMDDFPGVQASKK